MINCDIATSIKRRVPRIAVKGEPARPGVDE
jgi:hypothetical protein